LSSSLMWKMSAILFFDRAIAEFLRWHKGNWRGIAASK
jgi:hypothetical protein